MRPSLVLAVALAACTPEDPFEDDDPFAPVARCTESPQQGASPYDSPDDFGPMLAGSLAGWDANGRWFLTGVRVGGVSSFHFAVSGDQVIVDRDAERPGTIDDDAVFQRAEFMTEDGGQLIIAKRVSNRLPDGSLRADRAVCDGTSCRVCIAKLVRATHNAGEGEASGLALVSEFRDAGWGPGYTFNVRVAGTLAYLIREDGLHIIDTADPARPVELGKFRRNGMGYSNDVKLVDAAGGRRYALIADSPVDVVDVTDPRAPVLAGQIIEEAHTLFTETRGGVTRAYFGNYNGDCPVYDVTDPRAPVHLGTFATDGEMVHDLSVADGIAYLNAWDAGLLVVDFTAPASPKLLGGWADTPANTSHSNWTTTVAGRHIALHGDEGYGARLDVVDVDPASPAFMQPLATFKTRDWISIHNIMAFGDKAYFTHYQDGVRVISVADPTRPSQLGYFNTWDPQADYTSSEFYEGAVGLDVDRARGLVFVADEPRGLLILRDDTP